MGKNINMVSLLLFLFRQSKSQLFDDYFTQTALHNAAANGLESMVILLLQYGANPMLKEVSQEVVRIRIEEDEFEK